MRSLIASRWEEGGLALLRVVAAFLFMQHGAQKLFGVLGGFRGEPGNTAELLSRHGVAGTLEFFGGMLVLLGLFTRPVAFLLSGLMAFAYWMAHAPDGSWLFPFLNRGEPAVLFCFVFLYFAARGAGRYSLDWLLFGRKAERAARM